MRATLLLLMLALTATGVTMLAPSAEAMGPICVDNSPGVVQDCGWYLACAGGFCVDYPCRYCVPL